MGDTHTHTHTHTHSAVLPGGIQTQSELVQTSGSSFTACGLRGCGATTSSQSQKQRDLKNWRPVSCFERQLRFLRALAPKAKDSRPYCISWVMFPGIWLVPGPARTPKSVEAQIPYSNSAVKSVLLIRRFCIRGFNKPAKTESWIRRANYTII